MRENFWEGASKSRTLENGLLVTEEAITESEDEIVFDFTLSQPGEMSDLAPLWTPGSGNEIILEKLTHKGWVAPDHATLVHFKMDVSTAEDGAKWKIRYYKAVPGPEALN